MARLPRFLALLSLAVALGAPPAASAATKPQITATWVTAVTATSAVLRAEINPGGEPASARFDYITQAAYLANLEAAKDGFAGATEVLASGFASSESCVTGCVQAIIPKLAPSTTYRFRAVATNSVGTTIGPERSLATQAPTNVFRLPDNRGWEMVSPLDKNGGAIQPPEEISGGGVFQAAANGQALTYSSADSFGEAQGAPAGSQYIATRGGAGWSSENITTPLLSGSYGEEPDDVPYQLFSEDLSRGLLSNGQRCRGSAGDCPVANPPLPGTAAPAGYRDYYLRAGGAFSSLLTVADLAFTALEPGEFELSLAGAAPDLSHVVLSSCAALTAGAIEVAAAGGCDEAEQNLYGWGGGNLSPVNLLPGAKLAARAGAISTDGSRVYFTGQGKLYLRAGPQVKQVDASVGGGGSFQVAGSDGSVAFFTIAEHPGEEHLYRYEAATEASESIATEVQGVLGASADGSHVYYLTAASLFLWNDGVTTKVAAAAAASDYPPASGTSRVSPDGSHLLFLSAAELTGYENTDANSGQPDSEVYLYNAAAGGTGTLTCVSCNPTGERPRGASTIPGAIANGQGATATRTYKPRALSADGTRVFFDSADDLVIQSKDGNSQTNVYEWEAQGAGDCVLAGGCVGLISNGRSPEDSSFVNASSNGSDVFFLTDSSLIPGDPGSFDLYDAREGGGFPSPPNVIPCEGDACQSLPEAPEDPTPGTLVPNAGNPPLRFGGAKRKKHHKPHRRHGKKHPKHGGKK